MKAIFVLVLALLSLDVVAGSKKIASVINLSRDEVRKMTELFSAEKMPAASKAIKQNLIKEKCTGVEVAPSSFEPLEKNEFRIQASNCSLVDLKASCPENSKASQALPWLNDHYRLCLNKVGKK